MRRAKHNDLETLAASCNVVASHGQLWQDAEDTLRRCCYVALRCVAADSSSWLCCSEAKEISAVLEQLRHPIGNNRRAANETNAIYQPLESA